MTDYTQNNAPASPTGEGDSVTRNVIPMAAVQQALRQIIEKREATMRLRVQAEAAGHAVSASRLEEVETAYRIAGVIVAESMRHAMLQPEGTKPRT